MNRWALFGVNGIHPATPTADATAIVGRARRDRLEYEQGTVHMKSRPDRVPAACRWRLEPWLKTTRSTPFPFTYR